MRCRHIACVLAFLFLTLAATRAEAQKDRPEVGKYAKVYSGNEGLKVYTLRFGPQEKKQALLQFEGLDSPHDLRIFVADLVETGSRTKYTIHLEGKSYVALITDPEGRSTAFPPGAQSETGVTYKEELSKAVVPQHFLSDYLKQDGK